MPLLKGRRISKIRPEFVIFDPESGYCTTNTETAPPPIFYGASCSDDSDNERDTVDLCGGSPRFRRKNRKRCRGSYERGGHCNDEDETSYVDTLPEVRF